MELSPQSVASTTFKTVKKGYDPDEVRAFLAQLATSIESTQAQATAMEARARAAVARLQELAASQATAASPAPTSSTGVDESQTISRTLLLAQRTADNTIAEAEADAKRIRDEADAEARDTLESARETQIRLIDESKSDARRAGEAARIQIESEVQALLARREFLLSDVDHLEQHTMTHRDRLREVASELAGIIERGPGGLADLRRPLMSAVNDDESGQTSDNPADATQPLSRIEWMPVTTPTDDEFAATEPPADPVSEGDEVTPTPGDEHQAADAAASDTTPASGSSMPAEVVTGEVPVAARPGNDAFNVRDDSRR